MIRRTTRGSSPSAGKNPSKPHRSPDSVRMRATRAAPATRLGLTRTSGGGFRTAAACRSEGGEFLGQLLRPALRTRRARPAGGTGQHLAVPPALLAMKFVNWHGPRIDNPNKSSSGLWTAISPGTRHLKLGRNRDAARSPLNSMVRSVRTTEGREASPEARQRGCLKAAHIPYLIERAKTDPPHPLVVPL